MKTFFHLANISFIGTAILKTNKQTKQLSNLATAEGIGVIIIHTDRQ